MSSRFGRTEQPRGEKLTKAARWSVARRRAAQSSSLSGVVREQGDLNPVVELELLEHPRAP